MCSQERMRELTGIQILPFNTVYQLHADQLAGLPEGQQWLNLPEYLLAHWGGARVSEYTNATHTELVELYTKQWCPRDLQRAAPQPRQRAHASSRPAPTWASSAARWPSCPPSRDTTLIAPACHDTASAIAGIPATGNDWAYISSGTWSLVGTLIEQPRNGAAAQAENFTNLGAVGGRVCFHKNVNGMWLISQCMAQWALDGKQWPIVDLVAAAEKTPCPIGLLDVDDPDLLLPEHMPQRINAQRVKQRPRAARRVPRQRARLRQPHLPLAGRALRPGPDRVAFLTGKKLKRLFIVGGANQNAFLNRLTSEATGLEVFRGSPESSTVGNFAVQLATLEGDRDDVTGAYAEPVARWAGLFIEALDQASTNASS